MIMIYVGFQSMYNFPPPINPILIMSAGFILEQYYGNNSSLGRKAHLNFLRVPVVEQFSLDYFYQ